MAVENFLRKYNVFFVFLIMMIAIFFRLFNLASTPPGLYPDEAMNGNNALEAIDTGNYRVFYPENNGREGLFINIQSFFVNIFGNEPWTLRFASAMFGSFTILGLYFLTKQLFQKESAAMLAAFFMAVSFWHINFSRIGFRAIMAPFFLVWSMWLFWKLANSGAENRKNKIIALFAGIIFGLGFHSYIAYRITPILLIPAGIILIKKKQFYSLLLFIIGAGLAISPLALYFYQNPQDFLGRTSQLSVFSSETMTKDLGINIAKTFGMFFVVGDYNWRHNLAGAPQLWYPISALFALGIILSIIQIFKGLKIKTRKWKEKIFSFINQLSSVEMFLFIWMAAGFLPVIISNEGLPHALRAIILIPPSMIFAALGFVWLKQKILNWANRMIEKYPEFSDQIRRIKKEFAVFAFAFLIVLCIQAYRQYFLQWAGSPYVADAFNQNHKNLGEYLNMAPRNMKKYVIVNAGGTDARGVPMPAQTTMFITDTFTPEKQFAKNIYYIAENNIDSFIKTAKAEESFQIYYLENCAQLRRKFRDAIPELYSFADYGIVIQQK